MNTLRQSFFKVGLLTALLALAKPSDLLAQDNKTFQSTVIDLGIVASDLEKSVRFYTEAIGFKEVKGFSVPDQWTKKVGLTSGQTLDIRVFVLEEGNSSTKLKLMQVPGIKPKQADNKLVTSQYGFRYLTIQVTDMDAAMARLKKAGVTAATEGGMVPLPEGFPKNIYLTLVKDPDGNMIELVGPRKSQQ